MKAPCKLKSLFVILIVLCLSPLAPAQAEQSDQGSLVALIRNYFAAYAQKDLAALVRLWSERSPDLAASIEEAQRALAIDDYAFSEVAVARMRVAGSKAIMEVTASATITNAQTKVVRQERYLRNFALIKDGAEWKVWREAPASEDLSAFLEKGSEWKVSRDSIEQFVNVLLAARTDEERNRLLADNKQMITAELRDALTRRVGPLQTAGRYDAVISILRIARSVAERIGDKEGVTIAVRGLADAFGALGRGAEALQHYQRAIAGFEMIGSRRDKAITFANIAKTYFAQKKYADAIANYEKALAEYEALKSSPDIANTLEEIASVYYDQENYARALEYFERCVKLRETIGGNAEIASTLNSIGNVYFQQQNFASAIAFYQKSLAGFESLNDVDAVVSAISNIGSALYSNGDYDAALDYYQKGLKLEDKLRDRHVAANLRLSMATVYTAQGNYGLALQSLRSALAMFEALRNKNQMANALSDIGEAYFRLRNYPLALEHYEKSLKLFEDLKSLADTSMRLYAIGNVHFTMGNFDQAIESYQKALGQFESIGHAPGVASMLASIAAVYSAQQKYDLALAFYEKSLAEYESLGDRSRVAGITERIGGVYYAQGDYTPSLEWATRAVSMAEQAASLETLWRARLTQGYAYRATGQLELAQQSFEKSIAANEVLRGKLVRREVDAQRFFQSKNSAYVSMMELLVAQNRVPEAFAYAERIKSHQLQDILQSPRAKITTAMTVEEQTRERALENEVVQFKARINRERGRKQPDKRRLSDLDASLQKALSDYREFESTLYAAHPRLKMLRGEAEPSQLEHLTELLDAKTALLEFVVADSKAYLFALTLESGRRSAVARTGAPAFALNAYVLNVGRNELSDRITKFREMIARRDEMVQQPSREIYDLLLSSAGAQLSGKTCWLIVPDDSLWHLPFQALQSADSRYLIEDHAIAYAPSLTALGEMSRPRPAAREVRQLAAGFFANPAISKQTAERASLTSAERLDPSLEAESEVKSLERVYGAAQSKLYIGAQASEETAKQEANKFNVIHFAAPTRLNDASPFYSHVVLSQSEENGSEDGLLEAWEMMKLDLKADLVVLSASDIGADKAGTGDAIVGLAWSLFVAGCPTNVVSRWRTNGAATSALMVDFHRQIQPSRDRRRAPTSKLQALQRAALTLLKRNEYREPFYWAGFTLVGSNR